MSSSVLGKRTRLPIPKTDDDPGAVPSVVVFYMPQSQRTRVLHALRQLSADRTRALLIALGEIVAGEGVAS